MFITYLTRTLKMTICRTTPLASTILKWLKPVRKGIICPENCMVEREHKGWLERTFRIQLDGGLLSNDCLRKLPQKFLSEYELKFSFEVGTDINWAFDMEFWLRLGRAIAKTTTLNRVLRENTEWSAKVCFRTLLGHLSNLLLKDTLRR